MFYLGLLLTLAIAITALCLEDKRLRMKIILIALIVALAVVQYLQHRKEVKESHARKESGQLVGPSVTLLSPAQGVYPKLKLGKSDSIFVFKGQSGEPWLKVFDDAELTIWTENGEMKLSAKIRDRNGDLIAEIVGNEWQTKKDKRWDRNYRRNALEVKDATGDVVLQVLMLPDCIQFAGKLYSSKGHGVAIGSSEITEEEAMERFGDKSLAGTPLGIIHPSLNPPGLPLDLVIDPIFRYPSEDHLGELLEE